MSTTVDDGALVTKDASESLLYVFDWDAANLGTSVTISTSTFTITAIRPSGDTALTKDNPSILSGSRKTQVRVIGGTTGALYQLDNTIVTSESPAQTKERRVFIKIE
jgi:hypothetical protein